MSYFFQVGFFTVFFCQLERDDIIRPAAFFETAGKDCGSAAETAEIGCGIICAQDLPTALGTGKNRGIVYSFLFCFVLPGDLIGIKMGIAVVTVDTL